MWLTEDPWPPMILFGVAGVVALAVFFARQRGWVLVLAGVLFAACGATLVLERLIVTDGENVEGNVLDLTTSFARKDLDRVLSHFPEKEKELRGVVRVAADLVEIQGSIDVKDLRVTMKAENSLALAHFRANATVVVKGYGNVGHQPTRWEVTWQKQGAEWKIIKIERLNPFNEGEKMPLLDRRSH